MRAMRCLLISVGLALVACGEGGQHGRAGLQYTLTIAPGNYLFIYGHEFHGDVACTLEPGDSLRIGGLPVLPRRADPPPVLSEEEIREVFDDVPFIQERVQQGETWARASEAYYERVAQMRESAKGVYSRELARTGSRELAMEAALDSLDRSLLDPTFELEVSGSQIKLRLEGLVVPRSYDLAAPASSAPAAKSPRVATVPEAMEFLEGISGRLGGDLTAAVMEVLMGGDTRLVGAAVARALKQIEEGEKGNFWAL
jgi:hypothetical protein